MEPQDRQAIFHRASSFTWYPSPGGPQRREVQRRYGTEEGGGGDEGSAGGRGENARGTAVNYPTVL